MLEYMYITNNPSLARTICDAGVRRIFVDWEVNGKQERQGHLDTVMSKHSYEDAVAVRQAVPDAELMIRLNPFYDGTVKEVEQAIEAGADLIMLPMFYSLHEVRSLCDWVNGRVGVVPLFETPESLDLVGDIVQLQGIYEVYVGLNDLHLALNMDFMFEPLVEGMLDRVAREAKNAGVRFGFGGVARANEGDVSGAMVLGEHIRLGSNAVILSRTFYRPNEDEEGPREVFRRELGLLRDAEARLLQRSKQETESDRKKFVEAVQRVVSSRRHVKC